MIVEVEPPAPRHPGGRPPTTEYVDRRAWLDEHPGRWILWAVKPYSMRPYQVRDKRLYEVRSEKVDGMYRCTVRRRTAEEVEAYDAEGGDIRV